MLYEQNTLIPFWQYVRWLGLDGWRVAGVSRGQPSPSNYGNATRQDNCECLLDYDDKHVSRYELMTSLLDAEQFFIQETMRYPAPKQIIEETHRVENGWVINKNKPAYYENIKSFRPHFPCGDINFGLKMLRLYDTVDVIKTNGIDTTPLDIMSFMVEVPEETDPLSIRVFMTQVECVYCGEMTKLTVEDSLRDFDYHLCEIRPFCDINVSPSETIGMKQITFTVYSYILVKPSLLEGAKECLQNVVDTYIDEVRIYIEEKQACEDGYFGCHEGGCGSTPCSKTNMDLCITDRIVYKEKWFVPKPLECEVVDGECLCREVCVRCNPQEVTINYITGCELNADRTVPYSCFETIAKLAIALQKCEKDWCPCDICISKKIKMFSSVPKELVREGNATEGFGNEFQILVDKIGLKYADGFVPSRAMIEAMREISQKKCVNKGGIYVG